MSYALSGKQNPQSDNLSVSVSFCMEEKMTKLICRSNSTIVQWEIVGHSSSAITQSDIKKGFTIRTIGGADGVLHSALTVNTSLYSTRLGMWRVRCFNEKMITGQFICIQYNGRCMNEVSCDYHDCKISIYPCICMTLCSNNDYYYY